MSSRTVTVRMPKPVPFVREPVNLSVVCNPDRSVTVTADATTIAQLAGRESFGDIGTVQALLADRVADAWYAAGCPRSCS